MIKGFLIPIFALFIALVLPFRVLGQTTPQPTTSFSPGSVTSTTNFTVEVKVTANQTMAAQVFTINAGFDTSKLELTAINYLNGWNISTNLGGDGNSNLADINIRTSPQIKLIGEVLDPAGFSLTANQPVSFASLTFRVKAPGTTTVSIVNTSSIMWVKPDTNVEPLSLGISSLPVNQAGAAGTVSFRIAESPTALSSAPWQAYTSHPMPFTHTLTPPLNSGDARVIYVEFKSSDGRTQTFNKTFKFTPDPTITRLDCTHSPTGIGTNITIKGTNLGVQGDSGKVKVKGEEIDVTTWDETTGTITLTVGQRLEGKVAVAVTTNDNKTITKNCTINLTTVEFDTLTQCKVAGQFSASNVDVKVFERQPPTTSTPEPIQRQKITLDKDGKPQGFVPKFEKGKNYTLLIKAPGTLAKKVEFKAEGGTTILDPISFPVGDIGPASAPDGKINAFDKSELIRQWSLARDVSKSGDFNLDSRINSLDYSCMVKNFNATDETYSPLTVQASPSPSQSPSQVGVGTTAPAGIGTTSPTGIGSTVPTGIGVTVSAGGLTGTQFRVSFDPNFSTVSQQGNLNLSGNAFVDINLPGPAGQKTIYIQFFENNAWGPTPPVTSTINLTST